MTETESTSFLHIPIELRLEIYKHVIPGCLASGSPNDLTCLSLVCQVIHEELGQVLTAGVQTVSDAQTAWIKTCQKDREVVYEPLRLLCSYEDLYRSCTASKLTVTSVEPLGWTKWLRSCPKYMCKYSEVSDLEHIPFFKSLLAGL
jgi:hypothetical protein